MDYGTLALVLRKVNFGQPLFSAAELLSKLCSPLMRVDVFEQIKGLPSIQEYQMSPAHHTADQYIKESQNLPAANLPLLLRPRRLRQLHRGDISIWYFTACKTLATHLQNLGDDPERYAYGSYFEMAYGLWNALHLIRLPLFLDNDETEEALTLLQELTSYISSERCSRWVETVIIISYVSKWIKLLLNVETSLDTAKEVGDLTGLPAFESDQNARMTFLADYLFVLHSTGPGHY